MAKLTRREFVATAASIGASLVVATSNARASTRRWVERRDLYPEGVASGDPTNESVILWTRRAGVVAAQPIILTVEIAEDEAFQHVVAAASATVSAEAD